MMRATGTGISSDRLSPQRQAVPEFDTTAQGCRPATSVGGVLTGCGADIIVIGDPLKPEEPLVTGAPPVALRDIRQGSPTLR
jgi:hypothetical protein